MEMRINENKQNVNSRVPFNAIYALSTVNLIKTLADVVDFDKGTNVQLKEMCSNIRKGKM